MMNNQYGGIDMELSNSNGGKGDMSGKSSPRSGAAEGQGEGMGGYNASAVNKALGAIQGAAKATYSSGAGSNASKK